MKIMSPVSWDRILTKNVIKARLFHSSLLVLLLVMLVTSVTILYQWKQVNGFFEQSIMNQLSAAGEEKISTLTEWLQGRMKDMLYLAQLDEAIEQQAELLNEIIGDYINHSLYYDSIYMFTGQGSTIAGMINDEGDVKILQPKKLHEYDKEQLELSHDSSRGTVTFFGPHKSDITGKQVVTLTTPVKDKDGRPIGVMRGDLKLDALLPKLQLSPPHDAARVVLIDKEGRNLLSSEISLEDDLNTFALAKKAIDKQDTYRDNYRSKTGNEIFGVYHYIPLLNWSLGLEVQDDVIFGDKAKMRNEFMILFVSLVLGICLLLWWHFKRFKMVTKAM